MGLATEVADRLALINLEARYAKAWDSGDALGWASVFTDEGTFEISAVGDRPRSVYVGRQELMRFCEEFTGVISGVHLPALPYLEIDGDRASGHVNFHFVAIGRPAAAHTVSRTATGHYEVIYERVNGEWLMSHRLEKALESSRSEHFDY